MTIYVPGKVTLAKEFTWNESVWNPSMLSTALWLDAADVSTITESGGAVSQWNDKSGKARHASQGTASYRPTYSAAALNGLNAVSFDGLVNFLTLASALPLANTGSFDVFCAGQPNLTGRDDVWGTGIIRQYPGSDASGSWFVGVKGGGTIAVNDQAGNTNLFGGSITSLANVIMSWSCNSAGATAADRWSLRINASSPVAESTGTAASGWGTGNGEVGRAFSTSAYFYSGLIYEIVITTSEASTTTRQKIEGYLAHKWGLTANLPSDHPYKLVGPTP